ncbi:MAG: hypothetical protein AB1656_18695 [Candidatus Omnitrophota bacterium]
MAIIVLAGAALSISNYRRNNAEKWFEGPVRICPRETPLFYEPAHYRLLGASSREEISAKDIEPNGAANLNTKAESDEIPWVDGEGRDEVQATIHEKNQREDPHLTRLRYDSCYKERKPFRTLQLIAPEDGSLFPSNICPPYVEWEDPHNQCWQVCVQVEGDNRSYAFVTQERRWRFPESLWNDLKKNAVEKSIRLQIKAVRLDESGRRIGDIQATEPISIRISRDPADPYIMYRLVVPPFNTFKTPEIYLRDIRQDEPKLYLSTRREYCLNCHNFSSKKGSSGKMAIQVRSLVKNVNNLPTYLAIYDFDKREGFKIKLPFEIQMTTFTAWAPDGQKIAYSANQKLVALKPLVYETQLAAIATSDIAIYDVDRNDTYLVPGACDPNLLEIYPQWTLDGKRLIFSRSPLGAHPAQILYDLYYVDLDASPPQPKPVPGASGNGHSNVFSHYSPDGQWFSFCQSSGGDLIRASSDLYLLPGDWNGPARRLECNVDYATDSWHSWSSNSRWIVFSSKREGGVYAYLYFTHIDEQGRASPAVALPMTERPIASFNIPEFIEEPPPVDGDAIFDAIRVEALPRIAQLRTVTGEPTNQSYGQEEQKSE